MRHAIVLLCGSLLSSCGIQGTSCDGVQPLPPIASGRYDLQSDASGRSDAAVELADDGRVTLRYRTPEGAEVVAVFQRSDD